MAGASEDDDLHDRQTFWPLTVLWAALAVLFACLGIFLDAFVLATPVIVSVLLSASLLSTGMAFARLALRVRRMELENEGLIEELSQEFDKVKGRLDTVSQELETVRTIVPDGPEPLKRVVVK